MTAIVLNTELVSTRFDPNTRMNFYTVEKDGRRWTVAIHTDDFNRHGFGQGHKQRRQNHLTQALLAKMQGPPDPQPQEAEDGPAAA
jgi:hypothetical protein